MESSSLSVISSQTEWDVLYPDVLREFYSYDQIAANLQGKMNGVEEALLAYSDTHAGAIRGFCAQRQMDCFGALIRVK